MREVGLPYIAPVIEDIKTIVIRDQNVEGGMGVHFYDNALHGGSFIIQEKLENDATHL